MNETSIEFNKQLELDVLINDMTEVTEVYIVKFDRCDELTDVVIPEGVKSIGEWAFASCSGLRSVTIGNSMTSIGLCAFYNCSGLTSVTFKGRTLDEVRSMKYYPWGIENPEKVISVQV